MLEHLRQEQPITATAPRNTNQVLRRLLYVRVDMYDGGEVRFNTAIVHVWADSDATRLEWTTAARRRVTLADPPPGVRWEDFAANISDEALRRASSVKPTLSPKEEKALLREAGIW